MNFKTTVVLIVILAVVGGYLFYTRDQGAKTETWAWFAHFGRSLSGGH